MEIPFFQAKRLAKFVHPSVGLVDTRPQDHSPSHSKEKVGKRISRETSSTIALHFEQYPYGEIQVM